MKFSELYERAAKVCETRGMCAGSRMNASGQVCALGAIGKANPAGTFFAANMHVQPLVDILSLTYIPDNYNSLGNYPKTPSAAFIVAAWSNNLVDAGRSSEVIAGFRKAAKLLREMGQ